MTKQNDKENALNLYSPDLNFPVLRNYTENSIFMIGKHFTPCQIIMNFYLLLTKKIKKMRLDGLTIKLVLKRTRIGQMLLTHRLKLSFSQIMILSYFSFYQLRSGRPVNTAPHFKGYLNFFNLVNTVTFLYQSKRISVQMI